ncbi:MAG: Lrp/AsnC ligand binding domain-containing protein [Alphaproteobacteria bacterium]|jgi:DNA-binding Lrp family transcriptional regulator|uniref:Lrp/AsnC family transcriptional regulator n=1 Tax=Ciceribacter selenitireducens TaxID=448181 RepID=UPI00048DD811|nr:Lrp/AsnC ligand binding domain-containing protein [Ciceribacter selenitireducens]MBA3041940.1 Lrp/AsnC family transcriptional regulator [Rhizobiaceae bacterium]MBC7149912.1 Lrp/AsnC ligand binding domain-containing protein [Rhizobium sp.]MBU3962759.1 Lrp/AsnC ligand binding domain-containing protein [Alphaproteobacteria bacterium]MBW8301786.1 Lrp/AsnC ligand binding domain-containing protein [Hydrogenophaga sp.]PPJ46618.1 AsnC family transcriptional regulator [Rhizobium sp. KAs_5_22]
MNCIFIQVRCRPGKTYEVADRIYEKEVVSELYSTSGEYDLLAKIYVPDGQDVGKYVNAIFVDIPDVDRTLTTLTFHAF